MSKWCREIRCSIFMCRRWRKIVDRNLSLLRGIAPLLWWWLETQPVVVAVAVAVAVAVDAVLALLLNQVEYSLMGQNQTSPC